MGTASAGALLKAQASPHPRKDGEIVIAGKPVEVVAAPVTLNAVRITVAPLENGKAQPVIDDGSLVPRDWPRPVSRFTAPAAAEQSVKCGNLTLKFSFDPLTIQVDAAGGRQVQRLRIDNKTGSLIFQLGEGPVLGLGEGGPQFDRRGDVDRMRSGQGGYRLRTHGGRVPIPWLIGTGGWAMFIHQPYGTLDLTGSEGKFHPFEAGKALPADIFFIASPEPPVIMAEYARLTGRPALPPLWSL